MENDQNNFEAVEEEKNKYANKPRRGGERGESRGEFT